MSSYAFNTPTRNSGKNNSSITPESSINSKSSLVQSSIPPSYLPKFLAPIYPVITFRDDALLSDDYLQTYKLTHLQTERRSAAHVRSRRGALGIWNQWNPALQDSLSIEQHIRPDCPPVFFVHCDDDKTVNVRNSLLLDSALTANGVPHTFFHCKTGGHGFGVSDTKGTPESRSWRQAFLNWLPQL